MGLKVEKRPIAFEEEVDNFAEVGAVGTAVASRRRVRDTSAVWSFESQSKLSRGSY